MTRSIRSKVVSLMISLSIAAASAAAWASDWDIDASHSHVGFGIRHMMVSTVRGSFTKYTGSVSLDDKDITKSKIQLDIEAATIDTGNAKRDEHLRSAEFFDTAKFPKITFVATKIEKKGDDSLLVGGNLTIKGITKPVILHVSGLTGEVKDPWGGVRRGATASTKINRKDFGLSWNKALDTGGVALGDDVAIQLEVELAKKKSS